MRDIQVVFSVGFKFTQPAAAVRSGLFRTVSANMYIERLECTRLLTFTVTRIGKGTKHSRV